MSEESARHRNMGATLQIRDTPLVTPQRGRQLKRRLSYSARTSNKHYDSRISQHQSAHKKMPTRTTKTEHQVQSKGGGGGRGGARKTIRHLLLLRAESSRLHAMRPADTKGPSKSPVYDHNHPSRNIPRILPQFLLNGTPARTSIPSGSKQHQTKTKTKHGQAQEKRKKHSFKSHTKTINTSTTVKALVRSPKDQLLKQKRIYLVDGISTPQDT